MHNTFLSIRPLPFLLLLVYIGVIATAVSAKYGGVTIDLDGTLHCPLQSMSYCAGDSNSTEFIIHCHNGFGNISACSLDLVAIEPVGVKLGAACYEESKTSGNAVCVYDGKEYDTFNYQLSNPVATSATGTDGVPIATATGCLADYIMEGVKQHGSE